MSQHFPVQPWSLCSDVWKTYIHEKELADSDDSKISSIKTCFKFYGTFKNLRIYLKISDRLGQNLLIKTFR